MVYTYFVLIGWEKEKKRKPNKMNLCYVTLIIWIWQMQISDVNKTFKINLYSGSKYYLVLDRQKHITVSSGF